VIDLDRRVARKACVDPGVDRALVGAEMTVISDCSNEDRLQRRCAHVQGRGAIVRVDDGRGDDDLLNLVVEIKGFRGEDAKDKANTMHAYWVPGVNNLDTFGRWVFAEFKESVYAIARNFDALIERAVAGNTK
jgi:hypothetical protein